MNPRVDYPFKTDHDVMIALISDFNATIASIDKQITQDHHATLEVKELLEKQYQTLSSRISEIEEDLRKIDPKSIAMLTEKVAKHEQWIHDFNTTKHIAWVIASGGFLLIGYYLPSIAANLSSIFNLQK